MHAKQGVILCNLGTPEEATARGVRKFLAPFLSDQRVVELPRALWFPILYGIILPLRSPRVAKAYAEIWTDQGSPLQAITQRQCNALARLYKDKEANADGEQLTHVAFAMSYSEPALADVLDDMQRQGIEKIVILPLYPQFSATTTASLYDQWGRYSKKRRNLPAVTIIKDYHDHPAYIAALARSVQDSRSQWEEQKADEGGDQNSGERRLLLFSFHGIPEVNVKKGDPYRKQCERTAQLVSDSLGLDESDWKISFQSRFGKQEWLKPYTFEVLQELGRDAHNIDVICPAFSADCLETLEEISIESQEIFLEAGGKSFNYIPCLNDCEDHIELFYSLTKRFLSTTN